MKHRPTVAATVSALINRKSLLGTFVLPGLAALLLLGVGCSTITETAARNPAEMNAEPQVPVTLQPGDEVDIKFFQAQELNDTHWVLPDGTLYLELVGRVYVQGKTAGEVSEELSKLYEGQLKDPQIAVIPRDLNDRRIYVTGAVKTPGMLTMPGNMTALEAISEAGGFDMDMASLAEVVVIRQRGGKRYGCAIDMRDALEGRESDPFYLHQHDIVFVPRTAIVNVNQWIDQYINKVIPNTGFQWIYDTGTKTSQIGLRPGY